MWDSDVLVCDVPARLLPVSAAAAKGVPLPQPGERENHACCFNCKDGGEDNLNLCDVCPRSWHADCMKFLGETEVRLARARSLLWHCPLCHHQDKTVRKIIRAEAKKNREVREAELSATLSELEKQRAAYERESGNDDFLLHFVAATEREALQKARKRDRKDKALRPRKRRKKQEAAPEPAASEAQPQQLQQQLSAEPAAQQQEEQEQGHWDDEQQQEQEQEDEQEHEEQQQPFMDAGLDSEQGDGRQDEVQRAAAVCTEDPQQLQPVVLEAEGRPASCEQKEAVKLEEAEQLWEKEEEEEVSDVELLSPLSPPASILPPASSPAFVSLPELMAAATASPLPAPTVPSLRRRVLCAPAASFSAASSSSSGRVLAKLCLALMVFFFVRRCCAIGLENAVAGCAVSGYDGELPEPRAGDRRIAQGDRAGSEDQRRG